jgi:DNA-binding NarL/FixJ family response regulator
MISDPDLFAREGIKEILSEKNEFDIVCEASGLAETLQGLQDTRPDVCILEAALIRHSGLGFIRAVKSRAGATPLLVMSNCHERDIALRALRAGAAGYLPKDCTAEQLAYALKTAASRRPYVSDTVCELIVESLVDGRPKRQHDKLSDTDFEIFCLMAEGIPVPQIAGMCKLSVAGVRSRKGRIMLQMSLRTDAELVKYAVERKLIGRM